MNGIEDARTDIERCQGDEGANLVEYAMLMALIVVACLAAVTFFGNAATSKMSCASYAVGNQVGGVTC